MMKIGTLFRSLKILSISFLGMVMMVIQIPSAQAAEDHSGDQILLELALHKISQKYDVHFNYDRNIMKDVMVDYEENNAFSLAEALDHVFENTHFGYRIFEERYIVVFENNDEGTESLKNMITHMQDLVEERESVKKRTVQPVRRLSTLPAKDLYHKRFIFGVSGTVVDEEGEPLIGVNIQVKGRSKGTSTDFDGKFTLDDIDENVVLIISYVGYQTQEVAVAGQTEMMITLLADAQLLDEVVVVGYGSLSQREVSGNVVNLKEGSFNKGLNRNALDLLQGKVSGLTITTGSGDVTSDQDIRLRGTSSLTGSSQPFVVIDGVPGLSINSVAPQDIESISILKDASSTAIYGSRAASGVILITTKKGSIGQPSIRYEGSVAIDRVSNVPRLLTAEEWRGYARENDIETEGLDLGADTDWFGEILRTGMSQNHSLSFNGGGENSWYSGSFSFLDRQGVVKDNALNRYNARLNINQKLLNDRLNLSMTGAITERNFSPTDGRNFVLAYNMIPVVPVRMEDGTWFDSREYDQGNPVRNIEFNARDNKNSHYFLTGDVEVGILPELTGKLNLLKQRESVDFGQYNHSETERGRDDGGFGKRESSLVDKKLLEFTLNYVKSVENRHNLNVLGGYSYEHNLYQGTGAQNRRFTTDFFNYNNLSAGENLRPTDVWSSSSMDKLISLFGRVNYMLLDKYILTGTIRRDGSSKFGKNHKWGTFPSMSAAWILSEEDFLKDQNLVETMKLRLGYGLSGNQEGIKPYQSLQLYGVSGQYFDNGRWNNAYSISQNANPDLKWEETRMINFGIDFALLRGRIDGSVDYYDKETKDLLFTYEVPVPPYFIPTMLANVGTMSNKGVELIVNSDVISKSDFRWNLTFNVAHNKNKILKLSDDAFQTRSVKVGDISIRGGANNTSSVIEEGREVGTFYMWRASGLDEEGKYIIDDMVDGEPGLTAEDRTYAGSAQPKLTYGINNTFTYKNWDLNFFFRGVYGNDVLNYPKISFTTTQWLPGANVMKDALTLGLNETPMLNSYYLEKGSFLRLDNATLNYNFNLSGMTTGVKDLSVYVSGQNLLLITNYTGIDPEVSMGGLAPGVEAREYVPKSRTYSFGVRIGL